VKTTKKRTAKSASPELAAAASSSSSQRPSIGRIVLYRPTGEECERFEARGNRATDAVAAIVVNVAADRCSLRLFLDGPDSPPRVDAPEGDGPGCWSWPPRVG
jgi:hypothetical protein